MALTCELCGSTDFVKDGGLFVCQGCGTKYTLEEAQRIMGTQPQGQASVQAQVQMPVQPQPQPQVAAQPQDMISSVVNAVADATSTIISSVAQASLPVLNSARDFQPNGFQAQQVGAREANNYACRAWQMILDEYQSLEHPSDQQQRDLVARAKECLTILDDAAMLDPNNDLLGLLIYDNCSELVRSVRDTSHYEQREDGSWLRKSLDFSVKVELPGQRESFSNRATAHRKVIEQQYLDAHPDEVLQRERLAAQAEEINGRLSELKGEKKSQGLFNFAGKREVKDRMRPVEDELREVRGQISSLDGKVDDYVEQRLRELGHDHIRLDF